MTYTIQDRLIVSESIVSNDVIQSSAYIGSLQGSASIAQSASWSPPQIDYDPFGRSMRVSLVENDFIQTMLPFTGQQGVTGTQTIMSGSDRPGILRLNVPSGSASRTVVWMFNVNGNAIVFGNGTEYRTRSLVYVPSSVTSSGQEIDIGFTDSNGTAPLDGAVFQYILLQSSASLFMRTAKPGFISTQALPVSRSFDTWNSYEVRVNSTGTQVQFYYNDQLVGIQSGSAIPTGSARGTGIGVQLRTIASSGSSWIDVDYMGAAAILPMR